MRNDCVGRVLQHACNRPGGVTKENGERANDPKVRACGCVFRLARILAIKAGSRRARVWAGPPGPHATVNVIR